MLAAHPDQSSTKKHESRQIRWSPRVEGGVVQLDKPLAAIAMDENALEIIQWLASDKSHELDGAGLIDGLGAKLSKAGVPLHRIVFHLLALHPKVMVRSIPLAPGQPVARLDTDHGDAASLR